MAVLEVKDLRMHLFTKSGVTKAVDDVSFSIEAGERLGLVGESGCGKTMTCLSILRLQPEPAGRILGGEVLLDGEDVLQLEPDQMRHVRGAKIAMIPQDPMVSLNPLYTIGNQVTECYAYHPETRFDDEESPTSGAKTPLMDKVVEVLQRVRIPNPRDRVRDYPHQFSGGMRQRVTAAMGIATRPRLLIADEPTTSLDVTVQAQFLETLKELQRTYGMALLYITHDLGVVAQICTRVAVMYAGKIVEIGDTARIFNKPMHPYTQGLIDSVPLLGQRRKRLYQMQGLPVNLLNLAGGCPFKPRCPRAMDICGEEYPPITSIPDGGGFLRCWAVADDLNGSQ